MNNCYNCPFRKPCVGSAHSRCTVLGEGQEALLFAAALQQRPDTKFVSGDEDLLTFDRYGVESGWCMWPINFDPTWVKCNLPLNQEK